MADLSLDLVNESETQNDLLLVNNDLCLTSDAQSGGTDPVLQDILQNIRAFLGEWFMDNTVGMPWLQRILVKAPNTGDIDALFINIILSRPGVTGLSAYSFMPDFATRSLAISFIAQKTTGTVSYAGTLTPTSTNPTAA